MRQRWIIYCLLIALFADVHSLEPQTNSTADQSTQPTRLNVSVDEVSLTFHAADVRGLPVTNLQLNDLTIYDNYKSPRKILVFRSLQDIPIRIGILLDTSESMQHAISHARAIATEYVRRLLRPQTDRAFSEDFGYVSRITQPWTDDPDALIAGIAKATAGIDNPRGGTALFETLYSACLYQFGKSDHPTSGNVILLFTDGEDNTGHVDLRSVIDICQRANTSIYAFRPSQPKTLPLAPETLLS
jgi:Ca-activated chloride channel homolog